MLLDLLLDLFLQSLLFSLQLNFILDICLESSRFARRKCINIKFNYFTVLISFLDDVPNSAKIFWRKLSNTKAKLFFLKDRERSVHSFIDPFDLLFGIFLRFTFQKKNKSKKKRKLLFFISSFYCESYLG